MVGALSSSTRVILAWVAPECNDRHVTLRARSKWLLRFSGNRRLVSIPGRMKIRIGTILGIDGGTDPVAFAETVTAMEELGFDSLWLAELTSRATPDPIVGLTFAAARTTRLKLGTGVLVLPGRNPAVVAKQLASLDRLSGGRLLVAFGLGLPDPAERAAFPVANGSRGAAFDTAIDLVRRYLAGEDVDGVTVRPAPGPRPWKRWPERSCPCRTSRRRASGGTPRPWPGPGAGRRTARPAGPRRGPAGRSRSAGRRSRPAGIGPRSAGAAPASDGSRPGRRPRDE